MRCALFSWFMVLGACTLMAGKAGAAAAHPNYRIGKAPKAEFKVAGKSFKIDPEAKSAKQIRDLPPEHFDPITRPGRVDTFYHDTLKEHYEECRRIAKWHCGPFRPEFIYWVHHHWRAEWRARWAWHHRIYIDEALWAEWMADRAFAEEIAALQRANTRAEVGYMPPELSTVSPVVVYNDEYINAVYNPLPFLAVLTLKSLKPEQNTDWIGTAAADSILSRLSAVPGLFVADHEQVAGVLRDQKLPESAVADPGRAAQIGKAIDVERVVAGSYVVDGDKVLFNLRIVDVQTGAVQSGISKTIARDRLLDEMPGLASSLAVSLGYEPQNDSPAVAGPSEAITVQGGASASAGGAALHENAPGALAAVADPPPGKAARRIITSADNLTGDTVFTAEEGPYDIQDKLGVAEGIKTCTLHIGPSADVHGGSILGGRNLHIEITGTPDNPAILRNIYFRQDLGGSFKAQYAIFEDCKFRKGGGWYSTTGFSSKWELDKCLIRGASTFPKITHVDYGIKLTDCTFSQVTFDEIAIAAPKDQPLDHMKTLRRNWRMIDHCRFDNCTVPPTIFWCAMASNYTHCRFMTGPAFESDEATDVVAFVAGTTGDAPDRISAASPPKRAAIRITYAAQPFQVFSFPK